MKIQNKLDFLREYFIYFMMYSFIGYIYEVFLEVVVYRWGFSNRGMLFGPYLPVYGVGALAFLLCFNKILKKNKPDWFKFIKPFILFLGCMLLATLIELIASYILEFLIGSWPWQTYKDYNINFQARIALSPSIRFGLGGLLFLYILQPLFEKFVKKLSYKNFKIISNTLFAIIFIDLIVHITKLL